MSILEQAEAKVAILENLNADLRREIKKEPLNLDEIRGILALLAMESQDLYHLLNLLSQRN